MFNWKLTANSKYWATKNNFANSDSAKSNMGWKKFSLIKYHRLNQSRKNKISGKSRNWCSYLVEVFSASAIKAWISRIIDSFLSEVIFGTKSSEVMAVTKAFWPSEYRPSLVKHRPFLWCSLYSRFRGNLVFRACSISCKQSSYWPMWYKAADRLP